MTAFCPFCGAKIEEKEESGVHHSFFCPGCGKFELETCGFTGKEAAARLLEFAKKVKEAIEEAKGKDRKQNGREGKEGDKA